jgi:hypothetical protein
MGFEKLIEGLRVPGYVIFVSMHWIARMDGNVAE